MDHSAHGVPRRHSRLLLTALLAGLTIGAVGAFTYYHRTADSADAGVIEKLASIVGDHRLTRARLSNGFAYAPCQTDSSVDRLVRDLTCTVPSPMSWSSAAGLQEFAVAMRGSGQSGAASPDAHSAGIWQLVMGHSDDAVEDLREAARRAPSNARVLNDLAVGLSDLAQRNDDPSVLIDAFAAADSAVRLDGLLPEPQFTLAVLLEQLYLPNDAIAAWTRYLELDSKSPWASEARESLARLRPPEDHWSQARDRLLHSAVAADLPAIRSIVAAYPSETRLLIESQLAEWGRAISAGDTAGAQSRLDVSRALATPLMAVSRDHFLFDAVAAIDRASGEGDRAQVRALAEGHVALSQGIELFGERNAREGRVRLADARRLLTSGGSPMAAWASLFDARLQLLRLEYGPALETLTAIRATTPASYLVLRSIAAQYIGFIYDTRSDYVHSVEAYDTALVESRTTGESQVTLRVGSWLSQTAGVLRGRTAGWRALYSALAATPRYAKNDQAMYSVFSYAALATATDAPRLSLRYWDQVLRTANRMHDPAAISAALRRRAERRWELGDGELARTDIRAALEAAREIRDTTARTRSTADIMLASAHVAIRSSPADAQSALPRVVQMYRASNYTKGLVTAYLYLAQSRAASGMMESARAAFDSANDLMQRQRATIRSSAERAAFLDDARATIDQIVRFHADHSSRDAFEYFEQTRSRVLLERLTENRGEPSDHPARVLDALQRQLSSRDVVLSYAVLPHETLIWTIGRERFDLRRVAVGASEIEELVTRLQRSIRDPLGEPDRAASERLHELLIENAGSVEPGANLIVIPDRWLHVLPFAALRDRETGRFLVQDHPVIYAPSATLMIAGLSRTHRGFSPSSRVLAVGNPAFDARVFHLPALPSAAREADAIADLYGHQKALIGRQATDVSLERMAQAVDILHFAGHAVVGRGGAQLSHLVLASDGHSSGVLFASDIAQLTLPRTRLVVLSACSTGEGKLSATEGPSSLARAFFAAGVPAVLSSLWAIDDDDTADFFIAFHRRLAQGHPAAVALRETQIEWIGRAQSRVHPMSSWAAFQLFEG